MLLRAALFTSLLLAVWTFGRSAFALPAGLCDDRGASAIAPPPAFEAPDVAIGRARLPSSCDDKRLPAYARIVPAHDGPVPFAVAHHAATTVAAVVLVVPVAEIFDLSACIQRSPTGTHCRVERPPRG